MKYLQFHDKEAFTFGSGRGDKKFFKERNEKYLKDDRKLVEDAGLKQNLRNKGMHKHRLHELLTTGE
jgi:hypothetical protein